MFTAPATCSSRPAVARVLVALALALATAILAGAPTAQASSSEEQWSLSFSGSRSTNVPFQLFNERVGDEVRYGSRSCGINLVWSPGDTREWRFERPNRTTAAIRYGESLALYNTTIDRYVRYESRSCGINLGWSSQAHFEWRPGGGSTGSPIAASHLSLYNTVEKDDLVNFSRPFGINLRWHDDTGSPYGVCTYPYVPC